MDHSGHDMSGMNSTANATASAAGGGMSMGGGCKISMLLNYNTVDACFISSSWRISSTGMFAGSCIGILLLCVAIEAVRRLGREYDRRLITQARARLAERGAVAEHGTAGVNGDGKTTSGPGSDAGSGSSPRLALPSNVLTAPLYQPSFVQHIMRSFIYGSTFTAAFFVMLLGMYYNVYVLICIFLGHFIGYIAFGRDTLGNDGEACGSTGRCC